ncbi:ABC transporter ATP-binding protein [Flexibacterium corallicola]|uniref:ABC transporter ATP-binding protein n=1 Tax=Flexibacterium corallicola TaxID=3037259 RepID=UPI00286F2085|nr:ABC transporter ATP-binding protein [Pseudovibrio sp. M1P-2-3]
MIRLRNISKAFRLQGVRKVILDNVSMDFPVGSNVGILGHNGAGKSTFMKMLAGAILPDAGYIQRESTVSWPLGFGGGFSGTMTGVENIRFVSRIYGQDTEYMIKFVSEFSELGESLHLPINTYSSGMKARLSFGVSMAIDFDYYLIDEVTAVGDKRFKRKCDEVFKNKLAHSNIIMVSHSERTIKKYCDQACVLHDGDIFLFESVKQALELHNELQSVNPFAKKSTRQ